MRALGTALLARGYAGKRLALMGENSYAWVLAYFAIVNSGMTVVPFDKELSCEEIVDQMRRANIDAFVIPRRMPPRHSVRSTERMSVLAVASIF